MLWMIPLRDYRVSGRRPWATYVLIGLNVLVFLYTLTIPDRGYVLVDGCAWQDAFRQSPPGFNWRTYRLYGRPPCYYPVTPRDRFYIQYGLIPAEFLSGKDLDPTVPFPIWLTLLTSMFLHAGWLHLIGNMWYLWIFGDNVEASMGSLRYLLFYLLSGAGAAGLQMAVSGQSTVPMVGASGAISGVMGAYFVLFPWSRILTLVPIWFFLQLVEVPAFIFLGLWFLLQFFSGLVDLQSLGGTAWWAHIGGFLAGGLLVFLFKRRKVIPGAQVWWQRRFSRGPW